MPKIEIISSDIEIVPCSMKDRPRRRRKIFSQALQGCGKGRGGSRNCRNGRECGKQIPRIIRHDRKSQRGILRRISTRLMNKVDGLINETVCTCDYFYHRGRKGHSRKSRHGPLSEVSERIPVCRKNETLRESNVGAR